MKNIMILLVLLWSNLAISQSKKVSREEIEKEKKAFILKELDLSDAEAKLFWPVYQAYEKEIHVLRKERRKIKQTLKNNDVISDDEKYNLVQKLLKLERQEATKRLFYLEEFAKVVGKGKAAMVFRAEELFKKELFKKLKNLPPPPKPPSPSKGR